MTPFDAVKYEPSNQVQLYFFTDVSLHFFAKLNEILGNFASLV